MGAGRPTKRRRCVSPQPEPRSTPLFFKIPLELRLQIYDYALSDVTITVAEQEANIFNSGPSFEPPADNEIEGLPPNYVPLVKNEYDQDLVMIGTKTVLPYTGLTDQLRPLVRYNTSSTTSSANANNSLAGVSMDSGYASAGSSMYSIASATSTTSLPISSLNEKLSNAQPVTNVALLRINRQIRHEMLAHLQSRTAKQTTLYVTYPHGLLVLKHYYPSLLKTAKHVVITGSYHSSDHVVTSLTDPTGPPLPTTPTTKTLQSLVRTMYSSYRQVEPEEYYKTMQTLQMRIFYPDERRYSSVWGDDHSPVVAAMQLIPSGHIETKTWRGRAGNGVTMKAGQPPETHPTASGFPPRWQRNFSSVFRRYKAPRQQRIVGRRSSKCGELFWEKCFADEEAFKAEVPEEKYWSKS